MLALANINIMFILLVMMIACLHAVEVAGNFINCENMTTDFQVRWKLQNDSASITIQYHTVLNMSQKYLAFGVSDSNVSSQMIGANVFIATFNESIAQVQDYTITSKSICLNNIGVCPDFINGITNVTADNVGMDTYFTFMRPLIKKLDTSRNRQIINPKNDVLIVWAYGSVRLDGLPDYHLAQHLFGSLSIQFGRDPPKDHCIYHPHPWSITPIFGYENNTIFRVTLGPAGGSRGYQGITGRSLENVGKYSFYINGSLIPVLHLKRGIKYTFIIQTGNDNPFYITTDPNGGYKLQDIQHSIASNMAGINTDGQPIGRASQYCAYDSTSSVLPDNYGTFHEFKKTLQLACQSGDMAVLEWTPDNTTKDYPLLYYQSYSQKFMGWKIIVQDKFTYDTNEQRNSATTKSQLGNEVIGCSCLLMSGTTAYVIPIISLLHIIYSQ